MSTTNVSAPRDWDGGTYDRVSDPQLRWGTYVLERLRLQGDERVLDAGCGSGRVTELLLQRLPRGRVVAVDASPGMLQEAEHRLAPYGERVELTRADLAAPLPVQGQVDAVLSTATFHWITDHAALFRNLAAVLRPGGQLVFQCGGAGNIASVMDAIQEAEKDFSGGWPAGWHPWNFSGADETRERLEQACFTEIETWLNPEPAPLEAGEPLERFLGTVVLGGHLDRLPEAQRPAFVRAVASRLPRPEIDYVRLNAVARRAGK